MPARVPQIAASLRQVRKRRAPGAGYDAGPWELNLAFAHRLGSATITEADVTMVGTMATTGEPGRRVRDCKFCSFQGDYSIGLSGIYVDFSYEFD